MDVPAASRHAASDRHPASGRLEPVEQAHAVLYGGTAGRRGGAVERLAASDRGRDVEDQPAAIAAAFDPVTFRRELVDLRDGDLQPRLVAVVVWWLVAAERTRELPVLVAASGGSPWHLAVNDPGTVGLHAVNGGVERIVPHLAAELAPVRVNAVSPGVIDTPWWSFLDHETKRTQFESTAAGQPIGRIGTAEDVADTIAYLPRASFITGVILPVDGGMAMG